MRKVIWKVQVPQDVCIFCATRIQNARAGTSSRSQRRLFASTTPAQKPQAAATGVEQKEDAADQQWATPRRRQSISRPNFGTRHFKPSKSLEPESQVVENIPGSSAQHFQSQRRDLLRKPRVGKDLCRENSQISDGQHGGPHTYEEEQRRFARRNNSEGLDDSIERNESKWQGLRRKASAAGVQSRDLGRSLQGNTLGDTTYRDEEQMRRLESSRQDGYVRLDGHQMGRKSPLLGADTQSVEAMQRRDTVALSQRQPEDRSVDPSPSFTALSGGKRSRKFAKGSSERTGMTSTSANDSEGLYEGLQSDSLRSDSYEEPLSIYRSRGTRRSMPSRESEIVAPRDHGRTAAPLNKTQSITRRRERNQTGPSRYSGMELDFDDDGRSSRKAIRKAKMLKIKETKARNGPPIPIYLPAFITVSNLAGCLKIRMEPFLQKMDQLGFEGLSNDHILDAETAGLIASEYNFEPVIDRSDEQDLKALPPIEDKSSLPARPPIVTIMGHVDHGKTTLLDFLRKSSVAASEHGGITQHIGAFSVAMPGGRLVTFLDTPGHAAFLSMRQRGANVTDIVILVVAADDSVKPQTLEALKHAQSANVPIIVAINKIDKEDSRPEQVKQDLARYGLELEDFGGDTQVVCVSGKTGQGMAELEDAAVAQADILDIRAPTDGLAEGWVLEATTQKAGRVATVLVRRGTLKPGDVIVAGTSWARIRSLRNEAGIMVDTAGPGTPVSIDGWREQPIAGDVVLQSPGNDEQKAKDVVAYRLEASEGEQLAKDMTAVNEARRIEQEKREALERAKKLAEQGEEDADTALPNDGADTVPAASKTGEVFFILKADVSGSVEAVAAAVLSLGSSEIRANILRSGVGPITEFDIDHAAVAKGHIINFNVPVEGAMTRMAEEKGVQILDQSIIYRSIEQVKGILEERLPPLITKKVLGEAEIAQIFDINVKGRVMMPFAGCKVKNGEILRRGKVRVLRAGEEIFDGTLSSLKFVKKDITEARKGTECGMGFEGWTEFKVGDHVQTYEEKSEARYL